MEPVAYTIELMGPASIRVVDYSASEQRAYVSSVAVRNSMRDTLAQLVREYHLSDDVEFRLWGELRPDGYARASAFRISGALGATTSPRATSPGLITLPGGTILSGFLQADVPNNSPEGLAIFMSLLGVDKLKTAPGAGGVPCSVSVNTGDFHLEELYTAGGSWDASTLDRIAREWLPEVRKAIMAYFATRPEEMHQMSSRAFEKLVAELLVDEGFDVVLTPATRDGGYDILAVQHEPVTGENAILIECKRYASDRPIGVGLVRALVGVVHLHEATKGVLVTTSRLSRPAQKLVAEHSSRLVAHDYDALVRWLRSRATTQTESA